MTHSRTVLIIATCTIIFHTSLPKPAACTAWAQQGMTRVHTLPQTPLFPQELGCVISGRFVGVKGKAAFLTTQKFLKLCAKILNMPQVDQKPD